MNMRLGFSTEEVPDHIRTLRKQDIVATLRVLMDLKDGRGQIDDIDTSATARALGRRADGEPVPRRAAAHGARDQGAHGVGRYRHRHAARPDQREAGRRRGARVLRVVPALAVHGPDQPAVRGDAQAPPLGARSGRPDARARRFRGARRAPDALRPHLPDRDAGRAEYRPDQLARDLRQGEQVRLHRDALSSGEGRPDRRRPALPLRHGGGASGRRAGRRHVDTDGSFKDELVRSARAATSGW